MAARKRARRRNGPGPLSPGADHHRAAFAALRDREPLLLLPTRLETRFEGRDLEIRIYPDQVHLNEHRPLLTDNEQIYGDKFWRQYLRAGGGQPRREAEQWLTEQVPGRRAVWVALQTKPEVGPEGRLTFKAQRTRSDAPPAVAGCLPRRFAAVGFCNGTERFVKFGEPVPEGLAVSAKLEGAVVWSEADGVLPVDAGFAWMIDYGEAVKVGMGITVPLEQALYDDIVAHGLTLFVVGVREESPVQGARSLEGLLRAHLYTDGLEFVPQGTPTNNTDAVEAGWTEAVDDVHAWFQRELSDREVDPGDDCDAVRLSRALGLLNNSVLTHAPNGLQNEEATMRAMNIALWPVTWGRYLRDLLAPKRGESVLPAAAIERAQEVFTERVRGGAALPVIAIGAQPYGILPVQRTREGQPLQRDRDALELVLLDLKQRWRAALPEVPRLDPVLGDSIGSQPKDDAVAVLGSLPHPGRFVVRRLVYMEEYTFWAEREAEDDDSPLQRWASWYVDRLASVDSIGGQLDLLDDWQAQIDVQVTASAHRDARDLLDLVRGRVDSHLRRQPPLDRFASPYYTGVYASDRLPSVSAGSPSVREPKIIWSGFDYYTVVEPGVDYSVREQEWNRALVQDPTPAPGESAADYLTQLARRLDGPGDGSEAKADAGGSLSLFCQLLRSVVDEIPRAERKQYQRALQTLARLAADDVERLELRLRETLGLASHRLDAWFTALAHERLDTLREPNGEGSPSSGIQLGGFGWVLDLRPGPARGRESQGFVHAPSLGHAATAAVLRAGWNAHGTGDPNSVMAVDLRSERVRLGAWLLDGIRQGQKLGELLGYRFERELREADRAEYIDACRRAVLRSRGIDSDPRGPVDGLDLGELYQGEGVTFEGVTKPLRPGRQPGPELRPVWAALERIVRAMDAVADVSIADSVHHVVQGNADRASATLDAITTGAVAPPELRSIETPRPGASVTHRVVLLLEENAQNAEMPAGELQRNLAETNSALESWLEQVLGDLGRVVCSVSFVANGSEAVPSPIPVTLGALGISATNVVMEGPRAELDARNGWGRRVTAAVLAERAEFEGRLAIDFDPQIGDAQVSFQEFAQLARSLRSLLGRSRPMDARDLELPGSSVANAWDVAGAESRVANLRAAFEAAVGEIEELLPEPAEGEVRVGPVDAAALRAPMFWLANLGLPNAVPTVGWADEGVEVLIAEARSVAGWGRDRLDALKAQHEAWQTEDATASSSGGAPADGDRRFRRARRALETLVDRNVPLLPNFTCADAQATSQAFARSRDLLNDDPAAATAWLRKIAKVREDVACLDDVLTLSELVLDQTVSFPTVGQLPDQDVWVATTAPADRRKGYLGLWALEQGGLQAIAVGRAVAGLVVDTWLEQIPAPDVVTGVAMHFDAPSSRAPQSLLLVVPPRGEAWSFELVVDSLIETLEAAQLRAVDPDVLDAYGHQMPAIYPPKRLDAGALLGSRSNG